MIDYIKLLIRNPNIDWILKNPLFVFYDEYDSKTGEIKDILVAKHHFCKIKIVKGKYLIFSGSIHKMFNSIHNIYPSEDFVVKKNYKGFNGNQFSLSQINFIINYLEKELGSPKEEMIIKNIETGVNIETNFKINKFLNGLMLLDSKEFEFRYRRNFAIADFQRYSLKFYNKSKMYKIKGSTLKVECKYKRTWEIKDFLKTADDINEENLQLALSLLLKKLEKLTLFDYTIDERKLSISEINSLKTYSNQLFWINLKRHSRFYHKKNLKKIINNCSDNIYLKLKDEIIKNWQSLTLG